MESWPTHVVTWNLIRFPSAFKQIVSGDSIRAQRKHQNPFYFRNHAKLIFSSNYTPKVANVGYSWYKRIIPLLFSETFLDNKDVNKIDELTSPEELSGFLNLVLIALKQLIKDGNFAHIEDMTLVKQLLEDMYSGSNTRLFPILLKVKRRSND